MSSMETASTRASSPATDHGTDTDELDNDDDASSSEVSYGGNLRVRNFLLSSAAMDLTTDGIFRTTSRMSSMETSISRENSRQ
jgi:hypothetical protein